MDERRLVLVRRQADRNRKSVCVLNDIERSKYDAYQHTLHKERGELSFKFFQSIQPVKLLLARQRSLKKCLEMRQQAANSKHATLEIFGRYGGLSLDDMRHEVDDYICDNHPRLLRLRHVQRLLSGGKRNGALLDKNTASEKIHDLFNKFHNEREELLDELRRKRPTAPRRFHIDWTTPPVGQNSLPRTLTEARNKTRLLPPIKTAK
ncbi:uncharacterized protein LOC135480717 [Liolophura sinensis]|uniref:uncharacterized protein LOC135480717 n=1 Tax=Liolophura sinensis TaxID=3198878 RepID=UPI0031587CB2